MNHCVTVGADRTKVSDRIYLVLLVQLRDRYQMMYVNISLS